MNQFIDATLLLEGGAMRGLYTAGVLDAFMQADLYLPRVVGVSAGALNGMNYISGQPERSLHATLDFLHDERYMGAKHLLEEFSFFNFDFLLGEVSDSILPFDYETFFSNEQTLWAVCTDCRTGKAVFYEKAQLENDFFTALKAGASMPFLGKMIKVGGDVCLDGGVANCIPVPADLPFEAGKTVMVLTRHKGFRKPKINSALKRLYHRRYGRYPELLQALLSQPDTYNAQMDRIDQLEESGQVLVLRPKTPVQVRRTERSAERLKSLYDQGFTEATEALPQILHFLQPQASLLRVSLYPLVCEQVQKAQ